MYKDAHLVSELYTAVQVPPDFLISDTLAATGPESARRVVASATAFLSAETADWLAEQIGPNEIDVRAASGRVLRISLAANSISFALIEADTSRLFDPALRFPASIVRRAMSVPWHGPRRRLVSALRRLGRETIAFSLGDRTELQISFGPNWLHVAVVRALADGGLFIGRPRRIAGKEKGPAGNRASRGIGLDRRYEKTATIMTVSQKGSASHSKFPVGHLNPTRPSDPRRTRPKQPKARDRERWSGLRSAALMSALRSWRAFPIHGIRDDGTCTCGRADCPSPGKHPATPHGLRDATEDLEQVERWWRVRPSANVAVATGAASAVFVLDIDGPAGEASLRELENAHGALPTTRESTTGKGRHLWFRHPGGRVPSPIGLCPGIDVRADGAYVIAPPSRHVTGNPYRWRNAGPLAEAPAWLLALIRGADAEPGPAIKNPSRERGAKPERVGSSASALGADPGANHNNTSEPAAQDADAPRPLSPKAARVAMEDEADKVRRAPQGTRNDTLNHAAFKIGQLVGAKLIERDEAEAALGDAARACGLGDTEIARTLRSGLNAGEAQPRAAGEDRPEPTSDGVALTWHALLAHPDPEWLIDGVLMAGGLAVLYGPPKLGKSFVALDMACSIAAGLPWQGIDTRAGRVIYISAEGTPKRRALAWAKVNGADADKLLVWSQRVNIRDAKERRGFVDAVRAVGWGDPVLVVVDTLSQNFGGRNENDGDAMSEFIDALSKLRESLGGAAVLVLHHTGKDQSRGARGHSALPAAADTMIEVSGEQFEAPKNDTARNAYYARVELRCEFQRDDEPFPKMEFGLRRVDLGYTDARGRRAASLVVEPFDPSIHHMPKRKRDDRKTAERPGGKPREKGPDKKAHVLNVLRDAGPIGLGLNEWARRSNIPKGTLSGWVQQWMASEAGPVTQRDGKYAAVEFA